MSRAPSASAIEGSSASTPLRTLAPCLAPALCLALALASVGCSDTKKNGVGSGEVKAAGTPRTDASTPTQASAASERNETSPEAVAPPAPAAAPSPAEQAPAASSAPQVPATAAEAPKKDQVKMSKEYWPNGQLKYSYEMRRSANGKWARNGIGRAYFDDGKLEREGVYKNNVRIGIWHYYDGTGKLIRTEDRGADGSGGSTGEPPLP